MRFFNTTGPVVPADHYCIPPLSRLNLDEVLGLVRDKRYFVLHAPRQTGKTSALLALKDLLNSGAGGDVRCVYVNVEAGQALREDVEGAMRTILYEMEPPGPRDAGRRVAGEHLAPAFWREPGRATHCGASWRGGPSRSRDPWCCSSTRSTP